MESSVNKWSTCKNITIEEVSIMTSSRYRVVQTRTCSIESRYSLGLWTRSSSLQHNRSLFSFLERTHTHKYFVFPSLWSHHGHATTSTDSKVSERMKLWHVTDVYTCTTTWRAHSVTCKTTKCLANTKRSWPVSCTLSSGSANFWHYKIFLCFCDVHGLDLATRTNYYS